MIAYVFLSLFLIAAVFNVIGTRKPQGILFTVTKPMLLLTLCLYCITRQGETDPLLVGALAACWVGDILLMFPGEFWFTAGGVSFFAGHVMFVLIFARSTDLLAMPAALLIPAAAAYALASGYVMFRARKKAPKIMQIQMLLYLFCNAATNLFALSRLCTSPGVWTAQSYVGAVMFFLSDLALFLQRYDSGRRRPFMSDTFVMITYISAVLLITLGFAHP